MIVLIFVIFTYSASLRNRGGGLPQCGQELLVEQSEANKSGASRQHSRNHSSIAGSRA